MTKPWEDSAGPERRLFRRYRIQSAVRPSGHAHLEHAADLSLGGLYLPASEPRPIDACLPLRIIHPMTRENIAAVCRVMRIVPSADSRTVGLGLRFANIDRVFSERLRALVQDITGEDPLPQPLVPVFALEAAELDAIAELGYESPLEVELDLVSESVPVVPGRLQTWTPQGQANQLASAVVAPPTVYAARDCYVRALGAQRVHRPEEAVEWFRRALQSAPDNALDLHVRIASLALRELGDFVLAEEHLNAAEACRVGFAATGKLRKELEELRHTIRRAAKVAHATRVVRSPWRRR